MGKITNSQHWDATALNVLHNESEVIREKLGHCDTSIKNPVLESVFVDEKDKEIIEQIYTEKKVDMEKPEVAAFVYNLGRLLSYGSKSEHDVKTNPVNSELIKKRGREAKDKIEELIQKEYEKKMRKLVKELEADAKKGVTNKDLERAIVIKKEIHLLEQEGYQEKIREYNAKFDGSAGGRKRLDRTTDIYQELNRRNVTHHKQKQKNGSYKEWDTVQEGAQRWEIILSIGNKNSTKISTETLDNIYNETLQKIKEEYPAFKIISAVVHHDESWIDGQTGEQKNSTPHMHIQGFAYNLEPDRKGVGVSFSRSKFIKNNLSEEEKEEAKASPKTVQGDDIKEGVQEMLTNRKEFTIFRNKMQKILIETGREHGIEIEKNENASRPHMETREYQEAQDALRSINQERKKLHEKYLDSTDIIVNSARQKVEAIRAGETPRELVSTMGSVALLQYQVANDMLEIFSDVDKGKDEVIRDTAERLRYVKKTHSDEVQEYKEAKTISMKIKYGVERFVGAVRDAAEKIVSRCESGFERWKQWTIEFHKELWGVDYKPGPTLAEYEEAAEMVKDIASDDIALVDGEREDKEWGELILPDMNIESEEDITIDLSELLE